MRQLPLAFLCAGLALPAFADTRITAVTLSTAGLALLSAEAQLGAEGVRLPVRRADIDDFLKSLRLSDTAGGVPMLSMTGPGGMNDAFATLPFPPDALGDLRALIDAMTGAPVSVTRRGTVLEGVLMGARDVPCAVEGQRGCVALALRGDDGQIRQIALDDATELAFQDSVDQDAVARGLSALRNHARGHLLDVHLTSSNPDPRDIGLGWLQPAPVWKTAWRAETGADGVQLTGWAVLENATGHDWQDVELTLATGAVQALQAQLYDRLEAARKLAEIQADSMVLAAPMARSMAFETAFDVADVQMDQRDSYSSFTLSTPVTLRAGDMISLPFLQDRLDDARLTLYRGGSNAVHPSIALEIVNPLPLRLPAGILTLYEDGRGHAGDAMIPELAPSAREVVTFAQDTAIRVSERATESQFLQSARIADGVLIAEDRVERRTTYRIEGAADEARSLTIEHPLRHGWDLLTEGGETGFDATRFIRDIAAGQIMEHDILEQRITATRLAVMDLDQSLLAYWSGRVPDEATRALLRQMQDLRAEQADLSRQISRLQTEEHQLITDQERLVGLIVQLGDDSPATRDRRARVDAIEAQIDTGRSAITAAQARSDAIEAELLALIRG